MIALNWFVCRLTTTAVVIPAVWVVVNRLYSEIPPRMAVMIRAVILSSFIVLAGFRGVRRGALGVGGGGVWAGVEVQHPLLIPAYWLRWMQHSQPLHNNHLPPHPLPLQHRLRRRP